MNAVLRTRDLHAGYGETPVVRGVDIKVQQGEVVALFGANGAGKTTTLLTLAGALPVQSGAVELRGVEVTSPTHRRARAGIAFVPETRGIFMSLTVHQNLMLGRGSPGLAYDLFPELAPLRKRRAGLCSGGEQQMLALGRALASRPALLIVDELSLGLGPKIVDRLLAAIRSAADQGSSALIVEQHIDKALHYVDYAFVLRRGAIEFEGNADFVRESTATLTASYLGSVNGDDVSTDS